MTLPTHAHARARAIVATTTQEFVAGLTDLPESVRAELQQLTPMTYTGNAAAQAKQLQQHLARV